MYQTLVDTGANINCIDSQLAAELNLPIVHQRMLSGVHGTAPANVYLAQLAVPELRILTYGTFTGVQLAEGSQPHAALLGRGFLQDVTMTYEGRTGAATLSNG